MTDQDTAKARPRLGDHEALLDRVIPLLLLVTGCTGLVYEVVLGRYLSLHLGSSGASQAVTLAAFLGGLSGGALLAGRAMGGRLGTMRQPLLAYASLEVFVALWAAMLPTLADTPDVRVDFVSSEETPFDPGELSVAVAPPAIANALHAATRLRFRRLPLLSEGL